jgi:hypothetical protein
MCIALTRFADGDARQAMTEPDMIALTILRCPTKCDTQAGVLQFVGEIRGQYFVQAPEVSAHGSGVVQGCRPVVG